MKKRPSLQGIVAPPPHKNVNTQSHNDVTLSDADVPDGAPPKPVELPPVAPVKPASARRPKGKAKAEADDDGRVHRSLYAMPETIELVRRIAFEEHTTAQALYREGLLLMLQGRGHYQDKAAEDV